jgi:hypothetical protein
MNSQVEACASNIEVNFGEVWGHGLPGLPGNDDHDRSPARRNPRR